MPILYAKSAVPGSLYLDGRPVGTIDAELCRATLPEPQAHLLFVPHEEDFAMVARHIRLAGPGEMPCGVRGLGAILWPGGSLEIALDPPCLTPPRAVEELPFMGGVATLLRGRRVCLRVGEEVLPLGEGPGCGLRVLPGGLVAAFAQAGQGEALVIVAPGEGCCEVVLATRGEQILLSQEGDRVRVQENPPPGSLFHALREYRRDGDRYALTAASLIPTARVAATPADLARAVAGAVQLGAHEEALALLTPSLREAVSAATLAAFFGEFTAYTDARHTAPAAGHELLALLSPAGEGHVARLLAFQAAETERGLRVENVRAWEAREAAEASGGPLF